MKKLYYETKENWNWHYINFSVNLSWFGWAIWNTETFMRISYPDNNYEKDLIMYNFFKFNVHINE